MYLNKLKTIFVLNPPPLVGEAKVCFSSIQIAFFNLLICVSSSRYIQIYLQISISQLYLLIQIQISISHQYLTTSSADILDQILVKGKAARIEVDQSSTMFHICQVFQSHFSIVHISYFCINLHCHVLLYHPIRDNLTIFKMLTD